MRPIALFLALSSALAAADEARLLRHDVRLTLDPAGAAFRSVDRVEVEGPGALPLAAIDGVRVSVNGEAATSLDVPEGRHVFDVVFQGVVAHPLTKASGPTWVAGDSTPGTIGEEGSYLVRGFYVQAAAPARFRVEVSVPLPHRAVSQGRRVEEREEEGVHRVVYEGGHPADGLVVVSGPWVVDERAIGDATCRTYLYERDRGHHRVLLSSLEEEIPRFTALLGPVPDGRFDVVENFFATGYGFPGFTLLGETVIRYVCEKTEREGKTALPAGYLDHELVHCWLGNHLLVDYEKGNWCESLTTYFSNYGAAEREGRDAEHRAKVSRSFSLRVKESNDYPLREFREKRHDFENDIGYGKGSMLFHMLAREIGRDALAKATRHAVETRAGQRLGWDGLVAALSEGCGRDLSVWFEPWLGRSGAPAVACGRIHFDGSGLEGTILQNQDGPAYPLKVPVRVTTVSGVEEREVWSASKETAFRVEVAGKPTLLEIDPDHHLFRKIPRADVPPCLQAVLTSDARVGYGDPGLLELFGVPPAGDAPPKEAAVFCVGARPDVGHPGLTISERTFRHRERLFDDPGDAILLSWRRPDGVPVTLFHGNSAKAYARARLLGYYASDGWVLFRDGRPVERGSVPG
ncbi:MAG: M1 family aminopeptidase, partial [Planctomycetota bacterium]